MPLRISLRASTSIPLEVDGVRLDTTCGRMPDEIRTIRVQYGNRQEPLGEFFDVSGSVGDGSADDDEIVWEGNCSRVKLIGAHLAGGRIRVEGNAGMHLGAEMTGGEIVVHGDAADWVGAEMHGGRIHVHGNAGHLVGAVYRGGRRGMTGGEILIDKDAGNEIGHTMRRGTIAIGGRSGDGAGFGMIAGSVLLFGEAGIRPGAGMRRGTIGLLGEADPPGLLPTFKWAGRYHPVHLRLYLRHLRSLGFPIADGCVGMKVDRYCGDFLESGKGEILVRSNG